MADEDSGTEAAERAPKKSKKGLLIGLVLALAAGAGGFYAVYSGLLLAPAGNAGHTADSSETASPLPAVAFVPIQPILINVGAEGESRFLRFQAQLEVEGDAQAEVTGVLPRVVDVLNGYLRAVDLSELKERSALVRLRAQMLRRVQVVTGEGRVRDLLITEFVIN